MILYLEYHYIQMIHSDISFARLQLTIKSQGQSFATTGADLRNEVSLHIGNYANTLPRLEREIRLDYMY